MILNNRFSVVLLALLCGTTAASGLTVSGATGIDAPAAFRMMTRAEAASGASVAVTGVVTMAFSSFKNAGLLADASDPNGDAVYFIAQGAPDAKLKPGDVVAVSGTVAPMAYSPGLIGTNVEKLASIDLPPPPVLSYGEFSARMGENRRARIRGTLAAVQPLVYQDWETARDAVLLRIDTGDGVADARVPGSVEEWISLVDAELELAGVASAFFNARAQFVSMRLHVCEKDDISVLRAPPKDLFALPCSDFERILSYTPSAILPHAVHVIGDGDIRQTLFQVFHIGRKTQDRHDLGCSRDLEDLGTCDALCSAADTDCNCAQTSVVHVEAPLPEDPVLIES